MRMEGIGRWSYIYEDSCIIGVLNNMDEERTQESVREREKQREIERARERKREIKRARERNRER